MKKTKILLVGCAALLFASAALAGATPEAEKWLEKMSGMGQSSYSADYSMDANMAQMGQPMTLSMNGKMSQQGGKHLRMEATMSMTMPGMDQPMKMDMLNVKDGETLWLQINNPMMGNQVMKMNLTELENAESSNPMLKNMKNADVAGQLRDLVDAGDFSVAEETAETVTLTSPITDDMLSAYGGSALDLPEESRQVSVVMDKKQGFPREVKLGGSEPLMHIRFSNVKFTDSFADGTFSFTPPEGVNVMDIGAMMGSQ